MMDGSKIEWTDATWNPVVGCTAVSPGCDNCYAARDAAGRLAGSPLYQGLAVRTDRGAEFTGQIRMIGARLDQPLRWRKPRRIFVNSMSDLFHPRIPGEFIARVFAVMALARRHSFQVLTKRPGRARALLARESFRRLVGFECTEILASTGPYQQGGLETDDTWAPEYREGGGNIWHPPWPLPNVWLGTSIETDEYVWRADALRNTPAAVRFLSCEPLLGPLRSLDLTAIDWVIVGGESGPRARPMHPDWARQIRDRCVAEGVAFHFKQWGEWIEDVWIDADGDRHLNLPPKSNRDRKRCAMHPAGMIAMTPDNPFDPFDVGHPNWTAMRNVGKKAAGRDLDGRTWDEWPAVGVVLGGPAPTATPTT